MNTNMTRSRWFLEVCPCALDESSLNIGRVKYCIFVANLHSFLQSRAKASAGQGSNSLLSLIIKCFFSVARPKQLKIINAFKLPKC